MKELPGLNSVERCLKCGRPAQYHATYRHHPHDNCCHAPKVNPFRPILCNSVLFGDCEGGELGKPCKHDSEHVVRCCSCGWKWKEAVSDDSP